jgi:hypothetical protein
MVGDFLAKSSYGLSCEGRHLYVNSRVWNMNFPNQAESHQKLYDEVEKALENQNMSFLLQKPNCSTPKSENVACSPAATIVEESSSCSPYLQPSFIAIFGNLYAQISTAACISAIKIYDHLAVLNQCRTASSLGLAACQ